MSARGADVDGAHQVFEVGVMVLRVRNTVDAAHVLVRLVRVAVARQAAGGDDAGADAAGTYSPGIDADAAKVFFAGGA